MTTKSVLLAAGVGVLATGAFLARAYVPFRGDAQPAPAVSPAAPAQTIEAASASSQTTASTQPAAPVPSKTPAKPQRTPSFSAAPSRADVAPPAPQPTPSVDPVVPPPPVVSAAPPTEPPPPPVGTPVIEPAAASAPPKPRLEELTIKEGTVLGIRLDQTLSSETARVEDRVSARLSRDVEVDGRTAIPAGARLEGVVVSVERGGKTRTRARLWLKFSTLILADGLRVPITTDVISREGASPTPEAATKIGASAAVGAAIGAVLGGKKGAAIGTGVGAAGGTAAVMAGGRNEAVVASGTAFSLRLSTPVTIVVPRDPEVR